jgi:16S rRNA (guanine527-N7)-methyltransferase
MSTSGQQVLELEAARLGLALSTGALSHFARYQELIGEWDERAGLTSVRDAEGIQRRHFGESLALLVALREAGVLRAGEVARVVDVGTGAGFPGLPMRIVEPSLRLTLVESNGKRCAFLQAVVDELGLDGVRVVQARAEDAGRDTSLRGHFDVAVARALAALPVLVEYTLPLLREGGVLATPKGSRAREELAAAAPAIAALGGVAEAPVALSLPGDAPPQLVLLVRRTGRLDPRFPRRAGVPSRQPIE